MKSTFLIVADRGHLKTFRAVKAIAGRPPRLEPMTSVELAEGSQKLSEKLEDNAGRFPVAAGPAGGKGGGNGRHQNSVSEKHFDIEDTRRITKELAHRIAEVLRQQDHPAWSFSAPSAIKNAVIEELGTEERGQLQESLAGDLVKLSPTDLVGHFPSFG